MILRILLFSFSFIFAFCTESAVKTHAFTVKNELQSLQINQDDSISDNTAEIDTLSLEIQFQPQGNYLAVKSKSVTIKKSLANLSDSIQKATFENYLLNELIPHWYGTPWDFSGYTDTPGKGVVACGYFVSTVLKHAGFNIDRYRLAQQNPMNEALSIACGDSVEMYETDPENLQRIFKEEKTEGLYFAGLDFHVGFLLFRGGELYFIHSNYINSQGVVFEKAVLSDAFRASSAFRIVAVSGNQQLINKWLKNEPVQIIKKN